MQWRFQGNGEGNQLGISDVISAHAAVKLRSDSASASYLSSVM